MVAASARRFDAIVLGIGGMGSAAAYHLARRGKRVLGIERFDIPHAFGSSHGLNRIIRLAYFEHPSYVPLLRRAYELWRELEHGFGEQLLFITGSLDAGPAGSRIFEGSRQSCLLHDLRHEVLSGAEVNLRFPGYRLPSAHQAVLQPDGGFLASERAIVAHVMAATELGAEIHGRERVLGWEPKGEGVVVQTERGTYEGERLVLAAGAWAVDLLPQLRKLAEPERQVMGWFQPTEARLFTPDRFPVFNLLVEEGHYYGFPIHAVPGVKIGLYHHLRQRDAADAVDRECYPEDEAVLRAGLKRYLPAANGPVMSLKVCLFTNSPDEHFIIDQLPDYPQVVVAAGFSGHGYKFCSVVGEVLADLADSGESRHDIGLFSLRRFESASAP